MSQQRTLTTAFAAAVCLLALAASARAQATRTWVSANGGTINSFQGNSLVNNTAPGAFSSTTLKQ